MDEKYKKGNILKIPGFIVKVEKVVQLEYGKVSLFCSFGVSDTDNNYFVNEWISSISEEKISLYVPVKTNVCLLCKNYNDMWSCFDCIGYTKYVPSSDIRQALITSGWELVDKKPVRIVLGFPGIDKTYATEILSSRYKVLDLDVSEFEKDYCNFPYNYIDSVENHVTQRDYDLIFISAEEIVCGLIQSRHSILDHAIVSICYPAAFLKKDWLDMLVRNGYNQESLNSISEKFDGWIKLIESFDWCHKIRINSIDSMLPRLREIGLILPHADEEDSSKH